MIHGFIDRASKDFNFIVDTFKGEYRGNPEFTQKAASVAIRIFATLAMAASAALVLSGLVSLITAPIGALVLIGVGTLFFLVARDCYIISKNQTEMNENIGAAARGVGQTIYDGVANALNTTAAERVVPHPYTTDTLFKPVWDKILGSTLYRSHGA